MFTELTVYEGRGCEVIFKLHLFSGNSSKDLDNVAGELTLDFHNVKQNIRYRSMDCADMLLKDTFHDSNLANKIPCG
jgi:hypothetical protein